MKTKFKEINELLSVSLDGNLGVTKFRASIPSKPLTDDEKKVLAEASLYFNRNTVQENVDVPAGRPVLTDERYVYKDFRALSQIFLANRGLDFSTPGVLKDATAMLFGKTVYPNHDFGDISNWVGVVSKSLWDEDGAASQNVPGINVEIKVDAYLNYRIACGLMMQPPAVNAMSLTVLFEFEYSHPQLAIDSKWKFFDMLGEEVDGEIVRLIVTRIVEFWEASLVPVGEDRLAKPIGGGTGETSFSVETEEPADDPPANSYEEKTMKIPKEKREALGIGFDGEDVPETEIFKALESKAAEVTTLENSATSEAIAELTQRAEAGDKLVAEKRAAVLADAKIAELDANDATAKLDPVIEKIIEEADTERLQELGKLYAGKVAAKFPKGGRSSLEDGKEVEGAGGVADEEAEELPNVGLL